MIRTLATGAAVAGGGALAACAKQGGAAQIAEPGPPETTAVRIVTPPECCPGIGLAESYLREEGFTQISVVPKLPFTTRKWLVEGLADVAPAHPEFIVATIDDGLPLTVLAGLHSSCLELWAVPGIATVGDLRGRRISVRTKDMSDQFFVFFAALLGYVRIDLKDVHFVEAGVDDYTSMISAYEEGRADAVLAGGAQGPILKRRNAPGRVIWETMTAKPWSQYGCCHLVANRDWAQQNPNAAKRVTRAVLKATDAAAKDPARAAREYAAAGLGNKDASLVTASMAMTKYNWRVSDPEQTVLFFANRLAAANLLKRTAKQLIAQGLDLAYAKQLRGELKS